MNKKETGAIAGLKSDVGGLRNSMGEMRSSMGEMKSSVEEFKRHMGVLFEGLESEIKVIAEQHGSIMTKLEEHDGRFDRVDLRFDRIDLEFSAMKTGLFDTSHRVNDHEARIRKLESVK